MQTLRISRKTEVMIKKLLLVIFTLSFILTGILFTKKDSSRSFADSANTKYFKSIEVDSGDTLWDIAGLYMTDDYSSIQDYVDEIIDINHLNKDGSINSGCYIIVPYYSSTPLS
ncbi:MAG: LysM peptidoglycan-binding domain-containing protein [Lachnospiraceae bacterium]|nr:LysM peptidoglycan-binding domain-containing protein [Lachnospiraceae bacterium]